MRFLPQVENSGAQRVGTVRIFLAPKKDERGFSFRLREQRTFFIELDRFTTTRNNFYRLFLVPRNLTKLKRG